MKLLKKLKGLKAFLDCHVERSETSLAVTFTAVQDSNSEIESLASPTSSAALQLRFAQNDNAGLVLNASTLQPSTNHDQFAICSGNGHCAQSELSCMQKSS